jgi:hypothetical protein
MKIAIIVCFGLLSLAPAAAADAPVAVVEDIRGKVTGADFMDYVTPRSVIKIAGGTVILSYLNSCRRETITGSGTVVVGTEQSIVDQAVMTVEKTNCDSNQANATSKDTSGVAATLLRSVDRDNAPALPEPQLTLYGASPIIQAMGRGTLVVRRLDVDGERHQIALGGTQLKGKFVDFAREDVALVPGGLYAASFKSAEIVFRVDAKAKPGATPIVGRLLRLE